MDNSIKKNNRCISQNKWFLILVLMGLILAGSFGGYYIGVHNQQGQSKEEAQDLPPFLVKIYTKEHLALLKLIENQKEDKAIELLFLRLVGDLRAVNDYGRRVTGQKLSVDDHKELCDLIPSLKDLGKSKLIDTVPDAALVPNFRAELNTLAQTCVHPN